MFDALKIKNEIVQWIREYFASAGSLATAVIGISGGKDSTIIAALCVEAIGAERVHGVLMPNGLQSDFDDAMAVVKCLGISHDVVNIAPMVDGFLLSLTMSDAMKEKNQYIDNNLPMLVRRTVLQSIAYIRNGRIANTTNLSELYIGYITTGDNILGSFAPLIDLTATEAVLVGKECKALPTYLVEKRPEDGMCGQADEERFGFTYKSLDEHIRDPLADTVTAVRAKALHETYKFKRTPLPKFVYTP